MKALIVVLALMLGAPTVAHAAHDDARLRLDRLTAVADSLYACGQPDSAAAVGRQAVEAARLSGDREQVELTYRSELNDRPFEELLQASRARDLANEYTTSGIHRDDLVLRIGGYPLRKYGSQGQQKSFLIALKLAQYAVVAEAGGERPILLLDDLFDKLDAGRVEQLIRLVSEDKFGQIFISDCNKTRLRSILDRAGADYSLFEVENGTITR